MFAALALAAKLAAPDSGQALLGAQIFFWARVVYVPLYFAGIKYFRTLAWSVGVAGLVVIGLAVLGGGA